MAAAPNRNQHWVSQFYLRYFATPETRNAKHPRIWAFPISEGREFNTSTRNVAAERDLYAFCGATLDTRLQDLESLLGGQWAKFAHDHYPLDDGFKMAMALFISTLYLRHPLERQRQRNYHDLFQLIAQEAPTGDNHANTVSITIGDGAVKATRQAVEDLAARSEQEILKTWGSTILKNSGRLAEHLLQLPWSMLFTKQPLFVTSDNPIALYHPEGAKPGIRMPGTVLYFPVSPTRLLVIGKPGLRDGYLYPVLDYGEDLFNYMIFCAAYRNVFSPWDPARLLTQVINVHEWANKRKRAIVNTICQATFGRVPRNQSCPCGSGEKFKRCCGS